MGMRFRKSVKLAPGVRVNFSKKGMGLSVGTKGARVSVHSSGRRTTSVGIPGTGLSYVSSKGGGRRRSGSGSGSGVGGKVLFWLFIGWWWWPIRLLCYDLPKLLIKLTVKLAKYVARKIRENKKKPEA